MSNPYSPFAARDDGFRRLSRLTWRASQMSAIAVVAFAMLFSRTASTSVTTTKATPLEPTAAPAEPTAATIPDLVRVNAEKLAACPSPAVIIREYRAKHRRHHAAVAPAAAAAPVAAAPVAAAPAPPPAPPAPAPAPPVTTSSGSHGGG